MTYVKVQKNFSKAKTPDLYIRPKSRKVRTFDFKKGKYTQLSYAGLTFKVPWLRLVAKREHHKHSIDSIYFEFTQNKKFALFDEKNYKLVNEFKAEVTKSSSYNRRYAGQFLSENNINSDYAFQKMYLNTTPDEISIFAPRKEVIDKYITLILKYVPPFGRDGTYSFVADNVKGFQFGKPKTSKDVWINLYGNDGKRCLTLVFRGKTVSQDEIDFILVSMKPIR